MITGKISSPNNNCPYNNPLAQKVINDFIFNVKSAILHKSSFHYRDYFPEKWGLYDAFSLHLSLRTDVKEEEKSLMREAFEAAFFDTFYSMYNEHRNNEELIALDIFPHLPIAEHPIIRDFIGLWERLFIISIDQMICNELTNQISAIAHDPDAIQIFGYDQEELIFLENVLLAHHKEYSASSQKRDLILCGWCAPILMGEIINLIETYRSNYLNSGDAKHRVLMRKFQALKQDIQRAVAVNEAIDLPVYCMNQ